MIKVLTKKHRGYDYFRITRKIDGKWKETSRRIPNDISKRQLKNIINGLQTLCSTIDIDIRSNHPHSMETKDKISKLKSPFPDMLKHLGLLEGFNQSDYNIKTFLYENIESDIERVKRGEIVNSTVNKYRWACNYFIDYCDSINVYDLRNLTLKHCTDYRDKRAKEVAASSVQGEIKWLRGYLKRAVLRRIIQFNPFDGCTVKAPKGPQKARRIIIDSDKLQRIGIYLKQSNPDYYIYWSVVRWTGCRKNEALLLRWEHLDLDNGTMEMPSPKTANKGIAKRKLPIFPELKDAFEFARQRILPQSPSGFVIRDILNLDSHNRSKVIWDNKNASPQLAKMIKRCGEKPWPKLFQNLRVTRENELLQQGEYRRDAVHAFIGHTSETFDANYASLSPEDFKPRSARTA